MKLVSMRVILFVLLSVFSHYAVAFSEEYSIVSSEPHELSIRNIRAIMLDGERSESFQTLVFVGSEEHASSILTQLTHFPYSQLKTLWYRKGKLDLGFAVHYLPSSTNLRLFLELNPNSIIILPTEDYLRHESYLYYIGDATEKRTDKASDTVNTGREKRIFNR